MDLVYLDYNCFQRGFDDFRQVRIEMEALACRAIFAWAERGEVRLVWSFMHEDETLLCPFPARQYEAVRLAALCKVRVGSEQEIRSLAHSIQQHAGLSANDAVHMACAVHVGADYFLTCDDGLIKQAKRLGLALQIGNPVAYVTREMR